MTVVSKVGDKIASITPLENISCYLGLRWMGWHENPDLTLKMYCFRLQAQ